MSRGRWLVILGALFFMGGCADLSGQAMPTGDIPGWRQVFADNFGPNATPETVPRGAFSGCQSDPNVMAQACAGLQPYPSAYAHWFAYPDGWGSPSGGTYLPSTTVQIGAGVLGMHLTGGSIAAVEPKIPGGVAPGGGLLYGRYSVRAAFQNAPGYHVSFLLFPDDDIWPAHGEIDFPEFDTGDTSVTAFVHHEGATSGSDQDAWNSPKMDTSAWHIYTINRLPGRVEFWVDSTLIGTSTSRLPAHPMHWVLQMNYGGGGNVYVGIDWAVAYTPQRSRRSPAP